MVRGPLNLTLRQIQAFCTVARLGNFTKAASALHTTQPALSLQISQLEDSLGLRLFDRTTRAVEITSAGRELLPRAQRMLAEMSGIAASAADIEASRVGRVVVGALPTVSANLLPAAMAVFAGTHPAIHVVLRDARGSHVLDMLRRGELDFGIAGEGPAAPEFVFSPLAKDEVVAVMPKGHALARSTPVSLESLADQPLILPSAESSVRRLVDHAFAERGRLVQPVQEPVYMATAIALVRAGIGIALLPMASEELRSAPDLSSRRIAQRALTRQLHLVMRRGRTLSPAADAFIRVVRAQARKAFS